MVNFFFFLAAGLWLMVVQTAVLPVFKWFPYCFDLLIILVLYLSLAYSHYGVLAAIAFLGILMDSISGVPFFLHMFSYLWIYLIVQLLKQIVFQRSAVFMVVVSLVSILIQQGLILFSLFLNQSYPGALDYTRLVWQLAFGGLLIPPSIWLITQLRQNTHHMVRQFRRDLSKKYRG